MHSTILGSVQKYIGDKNKIRAMRKMCIGHDTIEELKTVTTQVDCDEWKEFFPSDNKGNIVFMVYISFNVRSPNYTY